ncbi:MAG: sulfite oxidase [Chloroflexi bacterium]|nr:sulfite oxidase [Chloroflexota bacterium]
MTDSTSSPIDTSELIVLASEPLVAETPLERQDEPLTPTERFFIRNHFGIPRIDREAWRLALTGTVARPRTITFADLLRLPARTLDAVVECAGNGRSFFPPPTEGNQFGYGAVSTASWTGVPLREVLGPDPFTPGTCEVLFIGADRGFEANVGAEIAFERSLPVDVALHPDTLLVYAMNGAPLPAAHGAPVRLLVPGWYGVASVKWLVEIRGLTTTFDGYFQKDRYIIPTPEGGIEPLRERLVRSLIIHPVDRAVLPDGEIEIRGLAWAGNQGVSVVEVSVDGGESWQQAELDSAASPYAWRRWRLAWRPSRPGKYILKSRATDATGRTQPEVAPWNYLGYANNGIQSVTVEVRG